MLIKLQSDGGLNKEGVLAKEYYITYCNGPVAGSPGLDSLPGVLRLALADMTWARDLRKTCILKVVGNDVTFNFRISVLRSSEALLVMYNGALDLSIATHPVFQRSSWDSELPCNIVNVEDSTCYLADDLAIGWGQGVSDRYYSEDIAEIIRVVSRSIGVQEGSRHLHFGSSAGGYQAIVGAALDPGSRACVNNPQIDWTKFFVRSAVDRLVGVSFGGIGLDSLREELPHRVNCIEYAARSGYFPPIDYYVNCGFESDLNSQFQEFLGMASRLPVETEWDLVNCYVYRDTDRKHNPMSQERSLDAIRRSLSHLSVR